ncbi:hypothetical protein BDV93DRAFT_557736 [Ceratobasidium sp. AG-I]|nr:hypothetical protein BDV93DRAFT_557736 [Ceratobasidium sp. AG-I]
MLSLILHPIIGGLSAAELREIHDSADEGFQLLLIDLPKLELIVKTWMRDVRHDGRLARWAGLDVPDSSTDSRETVPMVGFSFSARAHTPLRRVRAKLVSCWTPKVTMDEGLATAILSYWACYAAAPTQVSVRRIQRVKPRKIAGSDSTTFPITPTHATVQRRNRVRTHKFETAESTGGFATSCTSLQHTKFRRTQSFISASSSDSGSCNGTTHNWSTTIPFSSTAPELSAYCLVGTILEESSSEQRPYFLRGAASLPNLCLGSKPSYSATLCSSTSSSSSVAWGIGCSPAELAADGYMRDSLGDINPSTRDPYNCADEGQPSSSFRSYGCLSNGRRSGSMVLAMPETPLKRRQRPCSSDSPTSHLSSPAPLGEIEHFFRSHPVDLGSEAYPTQPGTPKFDRPSSFTELPPTPLKRRASCSFDFFEGRYGTRYCHSLGSDVVGMNTSQQSNIPLESTSSHISFLNSPACDECRDDDWEMVTPPVAPKRALPSHLRAVKRKRAMCDLRAGWAFPLPKMSSGPYASKTVYATQVAANSHLLQGATDNVRDAWWTTSKLNNASACSHPALLTPNGIPTNGATSYHMLGSRSLPTPSTVSLSLTTPTTSQASTPLHTPRASTEDLFFAGWANEWETEQHSLWTSALGDSKRQFSEEMIKPPRMNIATKLAINMGRMIGALWN